MKKAVDIEKLQLRLREFVKERKWEKYHNPKNLSMALTKEAAELQEIFQWLCEKDSLEVKNHPKIMQDIKDEVSDVLSYLLRIADVLEIDLEQALLAKIKKNEAKYPLSESESVFLLK